MYIYIDTSIYILYAMIRAESYKLLALGQYWNLSSISLCGGECVKKSRSTCHFGEFSGLATSLWLLWSSGIASVGGFGQR